MEDIKLKLRKKAEELHGVIKPPGDIKNLEDCYTIQDNELFFWFNVEGSETTKLLRHEILN